MVENQYFLKDIFGRGNYLAGLGRELMCWRDKETTE